MRRVSDREKEVKEGDGERVSARRRPRFGTFGRKSLKKVSPIISPSLSPRDDGSLKVFKEEGLGIPKSRSMNAISEELKRRESDNLHHAQLNELKPSAALLNESKSSTSPQRPVLKKKGSLADIFFMSSPLHAVAKRGAIDEVKKLCQTRREALNDADFLAWVNTQTNKNSQTACQVAIQHQHVEVAKTLTRLGSRLDSQDVNGRSVLLYCGRYGSLEMLRFFLRRCSLEDVAAERDRHGDGILHLAAAHGHQEIVTYLVGKKELDVNVRNTFSETPLHKACRTGDVTMVQLLLSFHADVKAVGRSGKPKHVTQEPEILELLREGKPVPSARVRAISIESQYGLSDEGEEDDDEGSLMLRKLSSSLTTGDDLHLKLRRAIQASSPKFYHGETEMSDAMLALRLEEIASTSEEVPMTVRGELSVLSDPDPSSGVVVEEQAAGLPSQSDLKLAYPFEAYRSMYAASHHNFFCSRFEESSAIVSVPSAADDGTYRCLLRYTGGYASYLLDAEVVAQVKEQGKMTQSAAFKAILNAHLKSMASLATSLTCAEVLESLEKTKVESKRQSTRSFRKGGSLTTLSFWMLIEEQPALNMELLALEVKLGLAKTLSVGVILMKPGQSEAEAMKNPMNGALEKFLSHLASPIETKGWSGYSGGLSTKHDATVYYASWRGLEIVFHVCPLLSEEQRRQFIGNDKVLLFFLDSSRRGGPHMEPKFRGKVNSMAITARNVSEDEYHFEAFHRRGMPDATPLLPTGPISSQQGMKDLLLAKFINGHVAAYDLLYASRLKRAWLQELSRLLDTFATADKKKKSSKK